MIKSDLMPLSLLSFSFLIEVLFPLPFSGNSPSVLPSPYLRRYSPPSQWEKRGSAKASMQLELGDFKKGTSSNSIVISNLFGCVSIYF